MAAMFVGVRFCVGGSGGGFGVALGLPLLGGLGARGRGGLGLAAGKPRRSPALFRLVQFRV